MSSHTTAANRGAGLAASVSRSAMPPSRGSPASVSTRHPSPWLRSSRSMTPDSTSENTAAMNQPAGSHYSQKRSCRRTDATGSCNDERGGAAVDRDGHRLTRRYPHH